MNSLQESMKSDYYSIWKNDHEVMIECITYFDSLLGARVYYLCRRRRVVDKGKGNSHGFLSKSHSKTQKAPITDSV